KFVGFKGMGRYRLSEDRGIDAWRYLKEIPEEELIEKGALAALAGITDEPEGETDARPFLTAEELGAGPNTEAGAASPEGEGGDRGGGGGGEGGGGGGGPPASGPAGGAIEEERAEPPADADGWIALPETRAAKPLPAKKAAPAAPAVAKPAAQPPAPAPAAAG